MEEIETSQQFKTTSHPLFSPTASHIASLSSSRLQIRCVFSLQIIRTIALPTSHDLRTSRLAWSPPSTNPIPNDGTCTPPRRAPVPQCNRVLVADDETTRVYDLRDEKWNAIISNGSGGMGKNVHVEFGRTEDEVLVWSDFASRLTVWCLRSGRAVEIKDPKFVGRDSRGWGYRPHPLGSPDSGRGRGNGRGGALALLCRAAGQDMLLLLAPKTYAVIKRVELTTTDAAGLKWSRDGRWIAIWDSAASGFNLHIYTADGHLYRTITREPLPPDEYREWSIEGLGIKSVAWVPGGLWLAVGGWDRRVRILSTRTFTPIVFLDHTAEINVPSAPVYTETVDARGQRAYKLTAQPVTPPKAALEKNDPAIKHGISILAFNGDATLCATRDDSTPTTVWIWDLKALCPRMILVQHAPVRGLEWHPAHDQLLLIQCVLDEPVVYVWDASTSSLDPNPAAPHSESTCDNPPLRSLAAPPSILDLSPSLSVSKGASSISSSTSKPPIPSSSHALKSHFQSHWLAPCPSPSPSSLSTPTPKSNPKPNPNPKKPILLLSHPSAHTLIWPWGKEQILRFADQEGDDSDDSLFEILTGRRGAGDAVVQREGEEEEPHDGYDGVDWEGAGDDDEDQGLADTFRGRGGRGSGGRMGYGAASASASAAAGAGTERAAEDPGWDESGMSEMF